MVILRSRMEVSLKCLHQLQRNNLSMGPVRLPTMTSKESKKSVHLSQFSEQEIWVWRQVCLFTQLFVWLHVAINYAWPTKSYVTTFSTGKSTSCDTPAVSISLENRDGQVEGKEKHTCQEAEVRAEEKLQASCSSEASRHLRSQAVLKLSFSEDQSFSGAQSSGELNASELPTGDEQSLSEVPHPDESDMMETGEADESVQDTSEAASCENITPCSCSEDEIEPSTDEELRLWRYPQGKVWDEEKSELRLEERKDGAVGEEADLESTRAENHKESDRHPDSRADECRAAGGLTEITGSSETQEEDAPGDERSRSDYPAASSGGGAGTAHSNDTRQPASESSLPRVGKNLSVGGVAAKRDQQDETEEQEVQQRVAQGDDDVELEHGGQTQRLPEVQVPGPRSEGDVLSEEQDGVEELAEGSVKAQGGESSKKVTFVLEPELIGDSAAETHSSGERKSAEKHLGQPFIKQKSTWVKSLAPFFSCITRFSWENCPRKFRRLMLNRIFLTDTTTISPRRRRAQPSRRDKHGRDHRPDVRGGAGIRRNDGAGESRQGRGSRQRHRHLC